MRTKIIAILFIALLAFSTLFADFGPPSDSQFKSLGTTESTADEGFAPPSSSEMKGFGPSSDSVLKNEVQTEKQSFWFHDMEIKILIVSVLIGVSLLVFLFAKKKKWPRKLLLIASVVIIGFVLGGILCPITTVQNIIIKFGTAYMILFFIPLVATLLFGRVYCSSVCPYGAISELLNIKRFTIKVPKKVDRVLKYVKYGILVFLMLRIFLTGELIDNTPFKALFTFGGTTLNWVMTGVFAFLSVFIYRPFCRYFCPYGAIMALISKVSIFKLRKDESCISCRICERECPMNAMDEQAKTDSDCILCGECCTRCPKDSLSLSTNKTKKNSGGV